MSTTSPPRAVKAIVRPFTSGGLERREPAEITKAKVAIQTTIIIPSAPSTSRREIPYVRIDDQVGLCARVSSSRLMSRKVSQIMKIERPYDIKSENMWAASAKRAVEPESTAATISATA